MKSSPGDKRCLDFGPVPGPAHKSMHSSALVTFTTSTGSSYFQSGVESPSLKEGRNSLRDIPMKKIITNNGTKTCRSTGKRLKATDSIFYFYYFEYKSRALKRKFYVNMLLLQFQIFDGKNVMYNLYRLQETGDKYRGFSTFCTW